MAKKNAYLEKRNRERQIASEIIQSWTAQLCLDVMTIVLNDPNVMGKDVFGPQRLQKIGTAFNEEYKKWIVGLSPDVKASYTREKMDERLMKIWGENFSKWPQRYYLWDDKGI